MTRSRFLYAAIMAVLAFAILVLWLNLREPHVYNYALDGKPSGPINQYPPTWLPPADAITENLLWASVEDVNRWYRFFRWGTRVYYFDDQSFFAGALVNRTARNPAGRWTIKGEIGGKPFSLVYDLREGPPPEGVVEVGPLQAPAGILWFARDYGAGPRTFSWVLER